MREIEKLGHDDVKGEVTYDGTALAILTRQGWYPLQGHPENVYRAAMNAIWRSPNTALASEIRRAIGEHLDDHESP